MCGLLNYVQAILFVYALFVPLGILIAYNTIRRSSRLKHEVTYLSFAIAIVLSAVITDIIKNAVGRPRPDLLARCLPSPDTLPDVLVTIDACTRADGHVLQDGWRSFPSGHSSFGFAGLGFLSLFLAGQLHVFRYASGGRDLGRTILCLAPLVGAALIAISRCEDYRHDVYDVCVGTVIGATVAYWSYRRHWPSLASGGSDEPYPRPGQEAALPLGATSGSANAHGGGWQRVRDQEEAIGGDLGDRDEVRYELR